MVEVRKGRPRNPSPFLPFRADLLYCFLGRPNEPLIAIINFILLTSNLVSRLRRGGLPPREQQTSTTKSNPSNSVPNTL